MESVTKLLKILARVGVNRGLVCQALGRQDTTWLLRHLANASMTGPDAEELVIKAIQQFDPVKYAGEMAPDPETQTPIAGTAPGFNTKVLKVTEAFKNQKAEVKEDLRTTEPIPIIKAAPAAHQDAGIGIDEVSVIKFEDGDPALKTFLETGGLTPGMLENTENSEPITPIENIMNPSTSDLGESQADGACQVETQDNLDEASCDEIGTHTTSEKIDIKGGDPNIVLPDWTTDKEGWVAAVNKLHSEGTNWASIAQLAGVSKQTVYSRLKT